MISAESVRITASAGTGKTTTLIKNITSLINNKVKPKDIQVVMFSKTACLDFKQRILSSAAKCTKASSVRVHTIHALALKLIKHYNNRTTTVETMECVQLFIHTATKLIQSADALPKDFCSIKAIFVDEAQDLSANEYNFI